MSYALGFGFGLACVAVLIYHFSRTEQPLLTQDQVALAAKVFREIQPLFPNQIREISFDGSGAHLVLADQPDVPTSQPFFVKFCEGNRCRNFITFSGQEIRLDGQTFQVLVDRQGAVMVMGERWVWSSSTPGEKPGRYRIAAGPLPTTS